MLSYAAPPRWRKLPILTQRRRAPVQLYLQFIEIPVPDTCVWEQLNPEQRAVVVETLMRLMVKATVPDNKEDEHD